MVSKAEDVLILVRLTIRALNPIYNNVDSISLHLQLSVPVWNVDANFVIINIGITEEATFCIDLVKTQDVFLIYKNGSLTSFPMLIITKFAS